MKMILNLSQNQLRPALVDEDYQTELTKAAEGAVEKGVNEISSHKGASDDDFKKTKTTVVKSKSVERKKKKSERKNRKKGRRK